MEIRRIPPRMRTIHMTIKAVQNGGAAHLRFVQDTPHRHNSCRIFAGHELRCPDIWELLLMVGRCSIFLR